MSGTREFTPTTKWSMLATGITDYLHTSGAAMGTDRTTKETHMSLCGGPYGRLDIPMDKNDSWLRAYAAELDRKQHSLFFCERRTDVFRMHFDLDFIQNTVVTREYVVALAGAANGVFRDFFPKLEPCAEEWVTIVLGAPPKTLERDGATRVKTGYHLIWSKLYVTQAMALKLRASLVSLLERTWDAREDGANSYHDVVDEVVLTRNGLRMYGSDKAVRCKVCKNSGKLRGTCTSCGGRGLLIENRAYTLSTVVSPDGGIDDDLCARYTDSTLECVRASSTRVSNKVPTPGFVVPDNAVVVSTRKAGRKRKSGEMCIPNRPRGLGDAHLLDRATIPVYDAIGQRINTVEKWGQLRVDRVFRTKTRYLCHVSGPGSSYCRNVGRAHGSSGIYFVITKVGIVQRCYSHKGNCRSYASGVVSELKPWLREALFGINNSITTASPPKVAKLGVPVRRKKSYPPIERIHVDDSKQSQPHPDFPGMTRGEVEKLPDDKRRDVQAECFRKLPDARDVYETIHRDANGKPETEPNKHN